MKEGERQRDTESGRGRERERDSERERQKRKRERLSQGNAMLSGTPKTLISPSLCFIFSTTLQLSKQDEYLKINPSTYCYSKLLDTYEQGRRGPPPAMNVQATIM